MTKSRTMTKDQFVADRHGRLMTATGIAGKVNDKTFLGDDWRHVDFRGSNLHQCDWEAGVDVSDAVFPGASFTRCSMRYGRFHDANIKHAEFQDCDLSGATFDNADIRGAHFDWCGLQGSSFSSGTKISDVSFRGADLRDASLTGAVMKRCDLRGADLRGATGIPDAAELVENGCTLAGAVGVVRADRDLAKYTVLRPDAHKDPAHYETATPMAAIATHLRDFPRDRRGRGKIELETAVVNNEPVKFVVLDNKPHLVVDHGDPTNQIVRLLGIDDAIPMEDAVIYEGDKASRVLRAIDADNHMESRGRSTHDIPLEWRLWNANPLIPGDRNRVLANLSESKPTRDALSPGR